MRRKATLSFGLALIAAMLFCVPAEAGAVRTISVDDASGVEPAGGGSEPMKFTVTLSKKNQKRTVKAEYETSPGSADPHDYQPDFGTVKFPAGKTKARISIPVRGDLFAEPDETFSLELSEPKRAAIDDGEAEGLIPANDNGPDGDGDDIPDTDDCAPTDANPEGQLECFVPTTIYDVNQGALAPGTRAYIENVLITAHSNNSASQVGYGAIIPGDTGYAGQDFSAIELRSATSDLQSEYRLLLLGTVRSRFFQVTEVGETQLCCEPVPAPISLTPAQLASATDALNGLLVEITGVSVASATEDEWLLTESSVRVDDDLFPGLPVPAPGTAFESIRGHADTLGAGTSSLSPRGIDDIDPVGPKLVSFQDSDTCLLPGEQDVTIGEVAIDEPQGSDTVVNLTTGDTDNLLVPNTVTITAGNTTASVVADAGPGQESNIEVVAALGPFEHSIEVTVDEFC